MTLMCSQTSLARFARGKRDGLELPAAVAANANSQPLSLEYPFMNPTLDLLKTRRSAPALSLLEPGPTPEELETLLSIASRVPDHGKLAPFRFIVFRGEAREKASEIIADVFVAAHHGADADQLRVERRRLALAPVVVGVVSRAGPHAKIPEWEQVMTAGAVCMNLIVAANAMGFATVWLTEWYAYDRAVLGRFGLTPQEKMAGFIHIGRNPAPRDDRPRPVLADIVTMFGA
jgi:nitroreductase